MGFSRQEYWNGVPLPSLDLEDRMVEISATEQKKGKRERERERENGLSTETLGSNRSKRD